MDILDTEIFLKEFQEMENSPILVVPDNMEKEEFDLMWQVLTASKPEDIAHITNEQLIDMLYHVDDVAEITSKRSGYFDCSSTSSHGFLVEVKSQPSASVGRRVL